MLGLSLTGAWYRLRLTYANRQVLQFLARFLRFSDTQPCIMAVRATVSRFPIDPEAQEAGGIPWGVTVSPFATKDENGNPPVYGSDGHLLPRCENCWAYFNTYCELDQWAWNCSLCGTLNGLTSQCIARYSHPQSCPEMMSSFIDLELPGTFNLLINL